uniref:C2H2-type domain-containing protein n=1 Tax=Anopheles dirus TaxID=7168 RepID=A0A182MYI6_9DIPT
TAEQQQLILKSLKKGKAKRSSKVATVSAASLTTAMVSPAETEKSTLIVPDPIPPSKDESPATQIIEQRLAAVDNSRAASSVQPNATPPMTNLIARRCENKVNIISDLILPRIIVSAPAGPKSPGVHSSGSNIPAVGVNFPILSMSSPAKAQHEENRLPSSAQYPKLYVLHRPSPAAYATIPPSLVPSSTSTSRTAASCSPVDLRPQLPSPSVSVTVLPATAGPLSPSFIPPVARPNALPTPIVTLRPTSPKALSLSGPSPPILPTPIVSVTISPMRQSTTSQAGSAVPNPQIVPKIVIDSCDADHDSQSSSSSTSSSASSCKHKAISEKQPNAQSNVAIVQRGLKEMGCSSFTRLRLRQKALSNLNIKHSVERCYGPQSSVRKRTVATVTCLPSELSTFPTDAQQLDAVKTEETETVLAKIESDGVNNNNYNDPLSIDLHQTPAVDVESTQEQSFQQITAEDESSIDSLDASDSTVERNLGFCGFSNSSIECAEYDFALRAVSIDSILNSTEIEPSNTICQGDPDHEPNQTLPVEMEMEMEQSIINRTEAKIDQIHNDESHKEDISEKSGNNAATSICHMPRLDAVSDAMFEDVASTVTVTTDSNSDRKEDNFQRGSDEESNISKVQVAETLNSREEHVVPECSVAQNNSPMREESVSSKSDGVNRIITETAITDAICESSVIPEPISPRDIVPDFPICGDDSSKNGTLLDQAMQPSPATELIDQDATGVDVIVAMARLRRENRVLSLDEESDREDSTWQESMTVPCVDVPTRLAVPSVSELRGSKKKQKRRKRKRDQFIKLLLKHVNYEALVADLVEQEKRSYGYESPSSLSSTEEHTTTSPLQRYISSLEREKEKEDDEQDYEAESDNEFAELDVEMAKAIVRPFLSNYSGELVAPSSSAPNSSKIVVPATVPKNETEERSVIGFDVACRNFSEVEEYAGEDMKASVSRSASDSKDGAVQHSIFCDRSVDTVAEEINKMETMQQSYEVEPAPCSTNASVTQEMARINDEPKELTSVAICDNKIGTTIDTAIELLETSPAGLENAVNCDTPSNAAVKKGTEIEEIDTTAPAQTVATGTLVETVSTQSSGRKRPARRSAATGRVVLKRMRTRLNVQALTPTAEVPSFDSSDAPNNEVVSDCSSGGLSNVEVTSNNNSRKQPTKTGNVHLVTCSYTGGGGKGEGDRKPLSRSVAARRSRTPSVAKKHETFLRSGRSRKCERHTSSSSNSSERNISDSCGGDLSSCDETTSGKRRRKIVRRKKRCSRRATHEKETVAVDPSVSTTVPSATATSSRTTKVSTHTPTASKLSKDSNPDTQYVISEINAPEEQDVTTPRLLEVVNVRNNRVLLTAAPSPRQTRSSGLAQPDTEAQKKDAPKRSRGRTAKTPKEMPGQYSTNDTVELPTNKPQEQNPNELSVHHDAVDRVVKCGNCGEEMMSSAWESHSYKHNGVAFRVGIDEAFDLKDIRSLSTAITRFMKNYRRTEVACERCGTIKKSCLGMASHITSCGLNEHELEQSKATCEHCGRKMKAVSLGVHQQQHCKVLKQLQKKEQKAASSASDDATPKEMTASGRKKRKSVATAEKKIKKLAKEVSTDVPNAELMVKVSGPDVANAVMHCWVSHLNQSNDLLCGEVGCAFFGLSAELVRTQYGFSDGAIEPKPIYQCAKCPQMATERTVIHAHLREAHPAFVKNQQYTEADAGGSENDSDVYVAGVSTSDDTFSSALDGEEEERAAVAKKGKGKKATGSAKPRKGGETSKSSGGKKTTAAKSTTGQQEALDERKDEETEVYKEMVLQESIEMKQDKNNFHLMTVKWMLQFRREHYAARTLFTDLRPDTHSPFQLVQKEIAFNYLPKITHSMRFLQCNSSIYDPQYKPESFANRWSQLGTFQGEALGCESIFFCGGPVVSLDWLPLADGVGAEDSDQYVAVACRQTYDEYYNCEELSTPQPRKCLIQIWNVGPIQNAALAMKFPTRCPQLAFAIACDYGPIWQIAFCPSGCYNDLARGDDFERLGLLAVAGSDGDVHLYALSRSMAGERQADTTEAPPRIVTLRPVLLLSLSFTTAARAGNGPASDFTRRSVVRLAWSRDKGHCVLAAGYSNGVVAVWNLGSTSGLLCGTKNGIRTLLPVHKLLHSSSSCITALDLHYGFGSRFLVVCNADRRMKVYDLRCGQYQPLETCSMVMRSRITSMRWLLHFPVLVYSYDDALCIDRCAYSVHQPREIGLRNFSIFTIGSETTDVGVNDWYSMNAIATRGGDLVCHRPLPFVNGMNYKKLTQILTTTIPLKMNATADSDNVALYNIFSDAYGLVFSDTDKVPTAMDSAALKLKSWRRGKLSHYPAERLNQIRWNPNSSSYTYYAIGYQAGFVRIRLVRM